MGEIRLRNLAWHFEPELLNPENAEPDIPGNRCVCANHGGSSSW
jgi:hypothetical protein